MVYYFHKLSTPDSSISINSATTTTTTPVTETYKRKVVEKTQHNRRRNKRVKKSKLTPENRQFLLNLGFKVLV